MFATPHEMYLEDLRCYSREYMKREHIQDMIDQYKTDALQRVAKITDVFYSDAIAVTIASGYEQELEQAIEIVNRLALNDKHIAALLNDYAMMEQIIDDEMKQDAQDQDEAYSEEY